MRLSLEQLSLKHCSYWQSVLCFGLPCIVLYGLLNYALFRLATGNVGLRYPWRSVIVPDIAYMFLVSTVWWIFMRQLAASKRGSKE